MLGQDGVLHLARLGRDLRDTKSLSRIQRIRDDLRVIAQYTGRIFELEVLAEFARAGFNPEVTSTPDCNIVVEGYRFFVEIVHRGQPFAHHLCNRIWTFKHDSAFRGAITITLHRGAGGDAENAHELGNQIAQDVIEAGTINLSKM
jgi:hypothetical protein